MKRNAMFAVLVVLAAMGLGCTESFTPTGPNPGIPPPSGGNFPAVPALQMLKTAAGAEMPIQASLPTEPSPARGQAVPVSTNCINDLCFTARVSVEFVNNPTGNAASLKVCLSINGTDEMSCRTGLLSVGTGPSTFDLGPWILPGDLPQWLVIKAEYYNGIQRDPIIGETRYALGYRR